MQGRIHRVTTFFHQHITVSIFSATYMASAFNGASRTFLLCSDSQLGNVFSLIPHSCLHQSQPLFSEENDDTVYFKVDNLFIFYEINVSVSTIYLHFLSETIFIIRLYRRSHFPPMRSGSKQRRRSMIHQVLHGIPEHRSQSSIPVPDSLK